MDFNDIGGIVEIDGHKLIKSPVRTLNKKILKEIIEESFGELLVEDYFPFLIENGAIAYLEFQCNGVANVIPKPKDAPSQLKTLAVIPDYQGNGLGSTIFNAVSEDYRKLNWCSREDRIANEKLYKWLVEEGIAEDGNPFFRKDKHLYIPYYINHTAKEKKGALAEMKKQLIAFKQ